MTARKLRQTQYPISFAEAAINLDGRIGDCRRLSIVQWRDHDYVPLPLDWPTCPAGMLLASLSTRDPLEAPSLHLLAAYAVP